MPHKNTLGNLALTNYNSIFDGAPDTGGEYIREIPLAELYPPDFHPFHVNDDEAMARLSENIKQYGIREPGLARPRDGGGYELLSGNRRKRACEIIGLSTMPVIVRELDDDSAMITIVDSNLEQREKILPSERAWAYRVMMEALNHKGVKGEMNSHEIMAQRTGIKKNQLFRIIRLTELINALLDKVDENKLSFNPAVALSYLSQTEQNVVASVMDEYGVKPSLSQAQRLKAMKQDGKLTVDAIRSIFSEDKKPPKSSAPFSKYFPSEYSAKQMEAVIIELLTSWKSGKVELGQT